MTYVMSDIHGNIRRFHSVMEQIDLQPQDQLYILGDLCDRHYGGISLLQQLRKMPNVQILYGNHEDMMCLVMHVPYDFNNVEDCALYQKRLAHWYRNGGHLTHTELLLMPPDQRQELLDYIDGLPVNLDITVNGIVYKLTHAAPLELYQKARHREPFRWRDARYFAVWKRFKADEVISRDYITIFGHSPTQRYQDCDPLEIWYGDHCIAIDCGCSFPDAPTPEEPRQGRLACLRLEDGRVFYSEE